MRDWLVKKWLVREKGRCCVKHQSSGIVLLFFCFLGLAFAEPKVEVVWEAPLEAYGDRITIYHGQSEGNHKDRIIVYTRGEVADTFVELFNMEGKRVYRFPKASLYAVSKQGKYIARWEAFSNEINPNVEVYNINGELIRTVRCLEELYPIEISVSDAGMLGIRGEKRECSDRCFKYGQIYDFSGSKIYDTGHDLLFSVIRFSFSGDYWAAYLMTLKDKISPGGNFLVVGDKSGSVLWKENFGMLVSGENIAFSEERKSLLYHYYPDAKTDYLTDYILSARSLYSGETWLGARAGGFLYEQGRRVYVRRGKTLYELNQGALVPIITLFADC